jgi:ankyrin repeat protein
MASTSQELFEAIERDDAPRVSAILEEHPALAGARDDAGVSALMRALYRSQPSLMDAFEGRAGDLDVFEAAALGDTDRLRAVLTAAPGTEVSYSGDGFTALHFASFFGHPQAVEMLLGAGAVVNAFGRGWMTGTALHSAVSRKRADVVRILLEAGADPNARQSAGWTALHSSAAHADPESVDLLLAAGADPAATNDEGRSVMDLAEESGGEVVVERIRAALQAAP